MYMCVMLTMYFCDFHCLVKAVDGYDCQIGLVYTFLQLTGLYYVKVKVQGLDMVIMLNRR